MYKGLGEEGGSRTNVWRVGREVPVQRFGRGGGARTKVWERGEAPVQRFEGLEGREGDSRTEVWREMRAGFCVRELFDQVLARSARA